ncbi:MAG: EamA/RhaT family transporter [Hyphomicrobiales bacterium]|nr:MAG: EamA/RhaT family transporter [Hyphomicrobiales bacterium]
MSGILFMSSAMFLVPVMDAIAKYLGQTVPPLEVALSRFVFQGVFAVAVAVILGRSLTLFPRRLGLHILRGAFIAAATLFFFTAVKTLPIADAIAIFFVEPMILTMLSALFLGESVGPRRWAAVAVGFVGALFIIRPGAGVFGLAGLLPIGAATCFAFYLILTRKLSGTASILSLMTLGAIYGSALLGTALFATTMLAVPGAIFLMPDTTQLGLMVVIGGISFGAHFLVVLAFTRAPAVVLAPLNYLEIVAATALGFFVFGDLPDAMTWIGIALIVGSGLYIAHRERQAGKAH